MKKKVNFEDINKYLLIALLVVIAIGLYFTLSVPKIEPPEIPPPQEISITLLGSDCEGCSDVSSLIEFIKQHDNVNVTEEAILSIEEAKEQLEKYGISKLPAVLVTGNTTNLTIEGFESRDDALVFDQAPIPFYDVAEKRIKGLVDMTIIKDSSCEQCFDIGQISSQLKQAGLQFSSERTLEITSDEGKSLIDKYKIDKIPTILFNSDALEYDLIKQVWDQVGTQEEDGNLVFRQVNPPYINVSSKKVDGLVKITYVVDETCAECYDPVVLKSLFEGGLGIFFKEEVTRDIKSGEGRYFVENYKLEYVPTVVLSKEAAVYPGLAQAWEQVGTRQDDGNFVMTKVDLLKSYFEQQGQPFVYKNLKSGEIIGLEEPASEEEAEIAPPEPPSEN